MDLKKSDIVKDLGVHPFMFNGWQLVDFLQHPKIRKKDARQALAGLPHLTCQGCSS